MEIKVIMSKVKNKKAKKEGRFIFGTKCFENAGEHILGRGFTGDRAGWCGAYCAAT